MVTGHLNPSNICLPSHLHFNTVLQDEPSPAFLSAIANAIKQASQLSSHIQFTQEHVYGVHFLHSPLASACLNPKALSLAASLDDRRPPVTGTPLLLKAGQLQLFPNLCQLLSTFVSTLIPSLVPLSLTSTVLSATYVQVALASRIKAPVKF